MAIGYKKLGTINDYGREIGQDPSNPETLRRYTDALATGRKIAARYGNDEQFAAATPVFITGLDTKNQSVITNDWTGYPGDERHSFTRFSNDEQQRLAVGGVVWVVQHFTSDPSQLDTTLVV